MTQWLLFVTELEKLNFNSTGGFLKKLTNQLDTLFFNLHFLFLILAFLILFSAITATNWSLLLVFSQFFVLQFLGD
jgi:hypothetical protein